MFWAGLIADVFRRRSIKNKATPATQIMTINSIKLLFPDDGVGMELVILLDELNFELSSSIAAGEANFNVGSSALALPNSP